MTVDSLGKEGISATRNNTLLRILEDVMLTEARHAVCENRGSGVGAIVAALRQSGLPDPAFDDRISSFRITIQNSSQRRLPKDRRDDILNLLRSRSELSRAELSQALGISDISTRKWLQALREEGLVAATEAKSRSKNVRYRIVK